MVFLRFSMVLEPPAILLSDLVAEFVLYLVGGPYKGLIRYLKGPYKVLIRSFLPM